MPLRRTWLVIAALAGNFTFTTASYQSGAAPEAKDWIQLFNGKDLDGWVPKIKGYALGENFGDTFAVRNGLLTVSYDKYQQFENRFGHLFYGHDADRRTLPVLAGS